MSIHLKTIAELSQDLHQKKISSVELTQHFLSRIEARDPELNSFISVTAELALEQAKVADQRIAQGDATPLTGIPIAHKDIFCTKGIKTTCASKMLSNFIAPYDATMVESLHHAGMVLIGKTNMDEFAMGSSNETSYYKSCKNPWDPSKTPGGSSGGSAAAVAARLTPAATGTDTGGSIRQPAALCGITGLKPTYGRVSRYGLIAFASSFDQAGPMTQTAEDAAILMNVMAGYDPKDSTSIDYSFEDYTKTLDHDLSNLKIGLPKEFLNGNLAPEITKAIEDAKKNLEQLGAQFVDIHLPHTCYASPVYTVLAAAECSSNLARFDGIRYGYRCDNPSSLEDLYTRSRTEGFGDEVKRRILIGTYVLSSKHYDSHYLKAQKIRRLMRDEFVQVFHHVDAILTPTTPGPAFNLGEKKNDPLKMYSSDIFTISANVAGLPALSMPAGFANKLPIGIQLIGNYFDEARLLNIAHRYQQITNWHKELPLIN